LATGATFVLLLVGYCQAAILNFTPANRPRCRRPENQEAIEAENGIEAKSARRIFI